MLFRAFCPASSVLAPALTLVFLLTLPGLPAAETSGEVSEVGKLKTESRLPTPEIEPASNEAELAISRMKLPAGFQARLWAAEPMFGNPVAFNFDERGRVFLAETHRYGTSTLDIRGYMWTLEDDLANRNQADWMASIKRRFGDEGVKQLSIESERLMLLEDTNGDGTADKSTVYADNFRTPLDGVASGVLARRGTVWYTNIPALWKFTGKDRAETREALHHGYGIRFNYTGHDLHGLILGPDGRIYFSIGDRAASVATKEGTVLNVQDTGAVFRCWPDGTGLEIFATGLRNPQSLLFNEYGDLFTGDNDSDQGDEERLVHLVENGESGWRIGYQFAPRGQAGPWNAEKLWHPRHTGQPAYLVPPICNIEDGPSGVAYYPGTGLTSAYAGHLFITHFKGSISNSGIFTYTLKPAGASYAINSAAPFLTGALPTDVRFGPDGKLYYSDWAEGWPKSKKGRLYAISDPAHANDPLVKSTQRLIAGDWTKRTEAELADLLGHADWRVRLEAQYTLAERGAANVASLAKIASQSEGLAPLHAVWALGQIARKDVAATEALRSLLSHSSAEVRAQTLKTLGDLRDTASGEAFVAALGDAAPRVKFFAAEALGKIKHAGAAASLVAAVRANNDADATLRHALVMGLVGCAAPDQLILLAGDGSPAVRLAAVLALRRLKSPLITTFLADRDPAIIHEAALAINDAPIPAAYSALAAFTTKPGNDEALLLRALNAHFRLGTPENAMALATFATRDLSPVLRKEAIDLLSLWPAPPARDRIVGVYLPLADKTRPAGVAAAALAPVLENLLAAHTPDSVQLAALETIHDLKLQDSAPLLATVVADQAQSGGVRAAALRTLDGFNAPGLAASAELASASDLPELRMAALAVVSRLHPESAVSHLAALIERGTPKEQQTAFHALGDAKDPAADDLILAQLARLDAGQVAPAAQLDLLEAAALRADPRVKKALADRDAALAANPDPLAPFRVALEGGNARNALKTIHGNPVVQCIRCHRIGDTGAGDAGPNLGGIGARVSREYILESIIKPSARIAPGFEVVSVTRKNGESIIGTLLHRDDKSVSVKTGENSSVEIAAADIKSVESAPSGMPEVAAFVLTKSEIRDLVEYLAGQRETLKAGAKPTLRAARNLVAP